MSGKYTKPEGQQKSERQPPIRMPMNTILTNIVQSLKVIWLTVQTCFEEQEQQYLLRK